MKRIFTCLVISFAFHFSNAQNVWMQKLNLTDLSPYQHTDSLTGVKDIEIGADGDIYVIANYGQSNLQELYKISPSGAPVRWRLFMGEHGGMTGSFTNTVKATADSGCIVSFNYWGDVNWWHSDGVVEKYSKDGILQWSQSFYGIQGTSQADNDAKDAIEIGNEYYAQVGDTVVKFDHNGNIISYDSSQIMPVQLMPNHDMIVNSPSLGLARLDSSGNVIWSSTTTGNCGCPVSYFYSYGSNTVSKINLTDGTAVWTKTYPWNISSLDSTADGGFVASFGNAPLNIWSACNCAGPGTIFRADASGDTLWSKTYDFPYYGLPRIKVHPSGSIITGGAFLYTNKEHTFFARDYSSFLASLDSTGSGPLQTTTLTWPGDANNNQVVGFNDDALYVGIAWGDTGQPRDTVDMDYSMFQYMPGTFSDYASDWTNFFANGANHKHADFNGDGVIDVNDLTPYSVGYWFPFNIPNWRSGNPDHHDLSVPDFSLVAEHDTVPPGGLMKYSVIAGNANLPVDSIYGFVFASDYDYTLVDDTPQVYYYSSTFGTPGTNVIGFDIPSTFIPGINVMMCRTDHNNVYQLNDTVAEITMHAAAATTSLQTFVFNISDLRALTYNENPVAFNLHADSIVIDPASTVSVSDNKGSYVKVFPNPVNDKLIILDSHIPQTTAEISVYNLLGEKVKTEKSGSINSKINVEDLPNGFYSGTISSNNVVKNFSFVVQH